MGLSLTVAGGYGVHVGSYTSFQEFRCMLAKNALGIDFDKEVVTIKRLQDLSPLLHHSDCDGEITPEDAWIVRAALRKHLKHIKKDFVYLLKTPVNEVKWYTKKLREWVSLCNSSVKLNEPICFG